MTPIHGGMVVVCDYLIFFCFLAPLIGVADSLSFGLRFDFGLGDRGG